MTHLSIRDGRGFIERRHMELQKETQQLLALGLRHGAFRYHELQLRERSAAFNVIAFGSPREFLERYDPDVPGCLVLDFSMPGLNGLQLQQALVEKGGVLPIIFLTGRGDIPISVQAMKSGAVDFLTKPIDDNALLAVIRHAIERDRIDRAKRAETAEIRRRVERLTPREREVLGHVIAGRLNKQIAASIGTVEKTVKVHRARVMEKMQAHSLAELVTLAAQVGITSASAS